MSAHSLPLLTNFWDHYVPPPGYESNVLALRSLILKSQQPQTCNNLCGIRKSLWVGGSTQNLRKLAHALLQAALHGCAIVGHWPPYVYASVATGKELRKLCVDGGRNSLHCYFLPISNCTKPTAAAGGPSFRFLDSKFDLSKGLDRIGNQTGLRSDVLVMGTLLSWVLRPQPELRMAVERYGAALGFDAAHPGARHRHLALHMRRGDKYSLHSRHMRNHSWRVTPEAFVAWGQRVAADIGAERVLYMTDDPKVDLAAMSNNLFRFAPAPKDCMPSNVAAGVAHAGHGASHTSAAKGLHNVAKNPELVAARLKGREAEIERECGPSVLLDDGIQLFAGILLMSQTAAFVGTLISNIGSAVVELMATQRHPPVFHDVLNDMHRAFLSDERIWYGGVHNPSSIRPLSVERLRKGDGGVTRGTWMEETTSGKKGR